MHCWDQWEGFDFWGNGLYFLDEGLLARDGLYLLQMRKSVFVEGGGPDWLGFKLKAERAGEVSLKLNS